MKKTILSALLLFSAACYSQQWAWAQKANNTTAAQVAKKITCSDSSQVYMIGSNYGQATFGTTQLDTGSFVVKYNSAGNALWAMHLDGDVVDVKTDLLGQVYLLANFTGSVTVGGNQFYSAAQAFYLAKYTGGGSAVWAKKLGSLAAAQANSLDVDAQLNVYVTGYYTDSLTLGATTLRDSSSGCNTNFFLAKFNAAGIITWATDGPANSSSAIDNYCTGTCVRLTKSGQPVVIGQATNWGGGFNIFILKYTSSGTLLQNQLPGGGDWGSWGQPEFALDDSSNIFHIWNADTHYDYYPRLIKHDTTLAQVWTQDVGGAGGYYPGYELDHTPAADAQGNVYLVGELTRIYGDSLQLCNQWLKTKGGSDALVGKLDRNGNCLWMLPAGDHNDEGVADKYPLPFCNMSVCVDKQGGGYIVGLYNISDTTGIYADTVAFGSSTLINDGAWEQIFVAKFTDNGTTGVKNLSSSYFAVYPNPGKGEFNIQGPDKGYDIRVTGLLGDVLYAGRSSTALFKIDIVGVAAGIYLVEINTGASRAVKKIVIE